MTAAPTPPALRWAVLVPLKPPGAAKSRLAVSPDGLRAELVLAMAADVVEVALACPSVGLVVIVAEGSTGLDPLQRMGAGVVVAPGDEGLNAALRYAAGVVAARDTTYGIASLVADVAAITVDQLARALEVAARHPQAFVPDAAGQGTTLVTARHWAQFTPEYGHESRSRHREAGLSELALPDIDGLRLDVDSLADLAAAAALGTGPRTRNLLARADSPLQ